VVFKKKRPVCHCDMGQTSATFQLILSTDYYLHHRVWFSFASDRIFVSRTP
jgi:hypothetical protein